MLIRLQAETSFLAFAIQIKKYGFSDVSRTLGSFSALRVNRQIVCKVMTQSSTTLIPTPDPTDSPLIKYIVPSTLYWQYTKLQND